MFPNLIPMPRRIDRLEGTTSLRGMRVLLGASCDDRIFRAARTLASELSAECGADTDVFRLLGEPDGRAGVCLSAGNGDGEGYSLSVDGNSVRLRGDSPAGLFYAVQTLRQLLRGCGGTLPNLRIADAPDMAYRGVLLDTSRGRVPTVETAKRLIDLLAYYKVNSLQFYVEHTFPFEAYDGIVSPDNRFTAEELLELDEYCRCNFVDFVPALATFGHLYRLLESPRWRDLAELAEGEYVYDPVPFRNENHTIDPTNPRSLPLITGMIDTYAGLFRSRFFNICGDETDELGQGRNKGRDPAERYLSFVRGLTEHVKGLGRTVLMWGDVLLKHPESIDALPEDVVLLNWDYRANPDTSAAALFRASGKRQLVCPGTWSWNHFSEVLPTSEPNIAAMVRSGHENDAFGVLNTVWGDYGHTSPLNTTLFGISLAAALGWNRNEDAPSASFDLRASNLLYGDPTGEAVRLLRALGQVQLIECWGGYCHQFYGSPTWMPQCDDPAVLTSAAKRSMEIADGFRTLSMQSDIKSDLLLACEGVYLHDLAAAKRFGGNAVPPAGFVDGWCARYAKAWRRESKESELYRVLDVIRGSFQA